MSLTATKEILADLIAFPTISPDSNLDMISYLAEKLEAVGARVEVYRDKDEPKANLFATLGPDIDGGIVLSGHSDVVPVADQPWTDDPFTMVEKDGKLFGRGACDMKGFIAACVALAPLFAEKAKSRPIHFAFTHDEETGCLGAQNLVKELEAHPVKPSLCIIGEPTEMRIIEGHKGCYEYSTHFHGLEGHGSAPDLGVNAAEYAVRYVAKLLELKEALKTRAPVDCPFDPPWTTVNVGKLSGGVAHNVIVSKAQVDWEMRPVQEKDADFVKSNLQDYCDTVLLPQMRKTHPQADIIFEIVGEIIGLNPASENEAKRIVAELTGANAADLVAFGTEAGLFQALGMDVVVCGPGSIEQAHKADEYVSIDQLQACLGMLEGLANKLE